ncbi:hypothetical protein M5D96_009177 [Drosophila gunungcola]|uniref:Uncharacterized protein n=1 Tax=Drosophila gunungcola TaxID=103775 RepID=A0A9Q0BNA5_9MUSC|nr:hypothetical protein M5D96_009177 [Drosophila gunungcola]
MGATTRANCDAKRNQKSVCSTNGRKAGSVKEMLADLQKVKKRDLLEIKLASQEEKKTGFYAAVTIVDSLARNI